MKAELDEQGCLTITAENAVESFALTHWWKLWDGKDATLLVTTMQRVNADGPLSAWLQVIEPEKS